MISLSDGEVWVRDSRRCTCNLNVDAGTRGPRRYNVVHLGVHYQARVRYGVHDRFCKNNKLGWVRSKVKDCRVKMCRLRGHEVRGVYYQARVRYGVHGRYCTNNKLGLVRSIVKNYRVKMCRLRGHAVLPRGDWFCRVTITRARGYQQSITLF